MRWTPDRFGVTSSGGTALPDQTTSHKHNMTSTTRGRLYYTSLEPTELPSA